MSSSDTILVVAAHPDDEVLGCGGVIARHVAEGAVVHVFFAADGETSRPGVGHSAEARVEARRAAAIRACRILGAQPPQFLPFEDQLLDRVALLDINQAIESRAKAIAPTVVYTHHAGDLNLDHRLVAQATLTAFRPAPGQSVRAIYGFETLSSTEWSFGSTGPAFHPSRFVDIGKWLRAKIDALAEYGGEMRAFPHPRSRRGVEALAALRGATVGVIAAEAFTIYRDVAR